MIQNHPQFAKLINSVTGHVSQHFSDWFLRLKDQVNEGEIPADVQDVAATEGVKLSAPVHDIIIRIQSNTSGNVDIAAVPQIEYGFDGQKITLEGMDAAKTVTLDDGDGLKLAGGASFTLGEDDVITLHYNAGKKLWIENTRSTN